MTMPRDPTRSLAHASASALLDTGLAAAQSPVNRHASVRTSIETAAATSLAIEAPLKAATA